MKADKKHWRWRGPYRVVRGTVALATFRTLREAQAYRRGLPDRETWIEDARGREARL